MKIRRFHKFLPITKYTLSSLSSQTNWIADPLQFNDPFEFCKRPHVLPHEQWLKTLSPENQSIQDNIHDEANNLGVVCYSACDYNNSLMWSVYADHHKGICLEFDIDIDEVPIHNVQYLKNLPPFEFDDEQEGNRKFNKNLLTLATTKSNSWSHEEEWRQVFTIKNQSIEYPAKLKKLYFGCRCPIEDMKIIWNLLIPIYNQEIEFWKGELHEGTFNLMFSHQKLGDSKEFPKIWEINK